MPRPSSLLIAYDAECSLCCRMIDRLRERDRWGLLVFFPLQSRELVGMAPELAGRPLMGEIHGLDLATRQVWGGSDLLPHLLGRLPGWRWAGPLLRLPGIRHLVARIYRRTAEKRFQKYGRQPFQDRF